MLLLGTWAFVNAQPVPGKVLFDRSKSPDFKNEGRILFAGGTNIANMRKDAFLETMLLAENPQKKLHIRNLGWDGDTVYEQFRDVGFGSWSVQYRQPGSGPCVCAVWADGIFKGNQGTGFFCDGL